MTTYKFCTRYNAGKKKLHRVSVPLVFTVIAGIPSPDLSTAFSSLSSPSLRDMVQHSHETLVRNVPSGTHARSEGLYWLSHWLHWCSNITQTEFCRGSISYFPREKALWPGICTVFALTMQGEAPASTNTLSSITTDDVQISWPIQDKVLQHSTEFNPCVKVERQRASGSARRAICKSPLCNIQYNGLGRFGSVSAT